MKGVGRKRHWYRSRKPVSLYLQHLLLGSQAKGNGGIRADTLEWETWVQPTPQTNRYHIRLSYKLGESPKVTVLEPDLKIMANGRRLPHVYRQDPVDLCLYQPRYKEWTPHKFLASTVVPWAVLWFYFFEIWLVTGIWHGNGEHPPFGV